MTGYPPFLPADNRAPKPTRRRNLNPDSTGCYRPRIGWKRPNWPHPEGAVQPRFNLGRDASEAERRYARIQELYADSCRLIAEEVWTPFALYAAGLLAQGTYRIPYDFQPYMLEWDDPISEYSQHIEQERTNYPSIEIVPGDLELWNQSKSNNRELERHAINEVAGLLQRQGIIPKERPLPDYFIPGSLHEALDLFVESDIKGQNVMPGTKELTQYGVKRIDRVKQLKSHSEDVPLMQLQLEECKAIVNHWRGKPLTVKTKTPMKKATVDTILGELGRFFVWLDSYARFGWRKPRGFDSIRWNVPEDDKQKVPVHKKTYSADELKIIGGHLDQMGKLALALGLNCAMGAAELGRLTESDFLFEYKHEFTEKLCFESTAKDSFCRFLRPKSKIFGEWILWPETVRLVRYGIERAKQIGTDLLFVGEDGQSWYKVTAPNPQYVFANMWTSIIEKLPDMPKYPFGSLRDTLPDRFRQTKGVGDEIASICLAHGKKMAKDKLIDCYGNRPFGRLHDAIRAARAIYRPMLSVL
jgi:integrase